MFFIIIINYFFKSSKKIWYSTFYSAPRWYKRCIHWILDKVTLEALDNDKGIDIVSIDLIGRSSIADYMVVVRDLVFLSQARS